MNCLNIGIGRKCVQATLRAPGITGFDKEYGKSCWVRLDKLEDVNKEYIGDLRKRRKCAEAAVDRYLKHRAK